MYQPQKTQDVPTTEPNKPLSQERQDLWDAAQLIRKHGLAKGIARDIDGRMCWGGAIAVAAGSDAFRWYSERFTAAVRHFNQTYPELRQYAPREYMGLCHAAWWNNNPKTTAEEVISKLEYAALS